MTMSTTTTTMTPVPGHVTLGYDDLPIDMRFNGGHVVSIVTYSILMVISAVGNITVLWLLLRRRGNAARTRINSMLIHLAIADLLVAAFALSEQSYSSWVPSLYRISLNKERGGG